MFCQYFIPCIYHNTNAYLCYKIVHLSQLMNEYIDAIDIYTNYAYNEHINLN